MFTNLLLKFSKESMDEIQGNSKWMNIGAARDPLDLWKLMKE
jgi:hypothetical protein